MHKGFFKIAALLGALSVMLGAFAAHGLKQVLSEKSIAIFETAVRYQFYHVFALMIAAYLYKDDSSVRLRWACRLFLAGVLIFSGSLYLLALLQPAYSFIGAITPVGGLCFIAGWVMLFLAIQKKEHR